MSYKDWGFEKSKPRVEKYPCATPGCNNFVYFSERDEKFYREKGWVDEKGNVIKPKRCKACRERRKAQRDGGMDQWR
jgi:hypothetical protein